jgi:hypothetical protein
MNSSILLYGLLSLVAVTVWTLMVAPRRGFERMRGQS